MKDNVTRLNFGRTVFDVRLAVNAARSFEDPPPQEIEIDGKTRKRRLDAHGKPLPSAASKLLIATQLAIAADSSGRVIMKVEEVMRRTKLGRGLVQGAIQEMEKDELLTRVIPRGYIFEWNVTKLAELAKQVEEEDVKFASSSPERKYSSSLAADQIPVWREVMLKAERRARSELPRFMISAGEGPTDQQVRFLARVITTIYEQKNLTRDFVALDMWRRWLRVSGRPDGSVKYTNHGWGWLCSELENNDAFLNSIGGKVAQPTKPIAIPVDVVDEVLAVPMMEPIAKGAALVARATRVAGAR